MRDNFQRFGNYLSIDVMRLSICIAKKISYIAPVILNEIGKTNVVYERFFITETHYTYTFILELLFKMSTSRSKKNVYAIFSDEFMTQKILDSIGIQSS